MSNISLQINHKKNRSNLIFSFLVVFLFAFHNTLSANQSRENGVVKAVRKVSPAVVNISSEYEIRKKSNPFTGYGMDPRIEKFFRDFFSPELERREKRSSLGSGVLIDGERGLVLTNAHVIEKAASITVSLNDQREFMATIVGMDPDSDLAVLKIDSAQQLPSIQMGDSDAIMIGESVIAIGNPFGFSHTVTSGVVSAINRSIKTDDRVFHEFIQTDASINPGNSGGPLINIDGELIGINTAIFAQAQGIGFAIPINRAKRIIIDLINFGQVVQAWLGISVQPIDAVLGAYLGIDNVDGVIISAVETHSPAEEAHLLEGDVIVSVDNQKITDLSSYHSKLKEISIDQRVTLSIRRKEKIFSVDLKARSYPIERALELADRLLGATVSELNDRIREKYGILPRQGVLITQLRRDCYLDRVGVRPGDTIHQIDEHPVKDISDFKQAIVKYRDKASVVLLIQRERHLYYVNVILKDNQ